MQTSNLSESDARAIVGHITTHLLKMGGRVDTVGVNLDAEGFWFTAVINGVQVMARRGEGNWEYQHVAADLLASALEGGRLVQFEELQKDRAPLTMTPLAQQGIHGNREN